jgi:hypothetical protein
MKPVSKNLSNVIEDRIEITIQKIYDTGPYDYFDVISPLETYVETPLSDIVEFYVRLSILNQVREDYESI